jgi:MFS family permease
MARWPLARNRDFMLVWTGETLSELGSQISTVAFPLLVLALTGSPAKAGVVGLAKWLPLAVFALPAGVLVDRLNRKRLMIACDAVRALALASIPVALAIGRPPFLQIVAVAFLDGGLFAVSFVAERSALGELVAADQLPSAVAQNEARWFGASMVGPPLGGLLFAAGRSLPFLTDAVSYLGSTLAVALTRRPFQQQRTAQRRSLHTELAEGLGWIWRRPFFRAAALSFAAGNPLFTGLYLLAILLAKRHGASSAAVGAMFAIVGAGGLLGAILATPLRRRLSARATVIAQYCLLAATLPLLLVAHAAPLIGLVVAAGEFLTPLTNSTVVGHRVALTPDELRGRVQAAATTLTMAFAWLGPLAVGLLFEHAGQTETVLALTAYAVALASSATLTPGLRRLPQPSQDQAHEYNASTQGVPASGLAGRDGHVNVPSPTQQSSRQPGADRPPV